MLLRICFLLDLFFRYRYTTLELALSKWERFFAIPLLLTCQQESQPGNTLALSESALVDFSIVSG